MGVDRKKGITMQMEEGLKKGIGWRKIMKLRVDIPKRRVGTPRFYSSSTFGRHHCHHYQHPYRKSERGFFP